MLETQLSRIPYFTNILLLGWLQCNSIHVHGGFHKAKKKITGSHAYILFKSGYDEYINAFSTVNCTADRIFEHISSVYRSDKCLFTQESSGKRIHSQ